MKERRELRGVVLDENGNRKGVARKDRDGNVAVRFNFPDTPADKFPDGWSIFWDSFGLGLLDAPAVII